jgi:hypothetical protein
MQFSSKQVVTMVVAVCTAAVLAPVAVGAATGQLVNIVDTTNSGRAAKVTSNGAVSVAQHAAPPANASNGGIGRAGLGYIALATYTVPSRLAITDITILPLASTAGVHQFYLDAWIRKGSVGSCSSPNTTDFYHYTLRRVAAKTDETLHLTFPGMPLLTPVATSAGAYGCFGVTLSSAPASPMTYVYMGSYRYTP